MAKHQSLLTLLSNGEWHSGEELAASLGVSRTAIWKQLNRLKERGIQLERIRGKGYRLINAPDILDSQAILCAIDQPWRPQIRLDVHHSIDSTNQTLMAENRGCSDNIRLCVADQQTLGRGRRGRGWVSPPGKNVYLSMAVALKGGFTALDGLSLVVGLAVAKALESMGLASPALKWPNDILASSRKLAGVLIELQGELEGAVRVVIGIGINVHMADEEKRVDQPWVSLSQAAPDHVWKRNELISSVANHVLDALDQFEVSGFTGFMPEWQARDALEGVPLRTEPGGHQGLGAGVDQFGAYRLATADGEILLRSGEVSIRRDNDSPG